MRFAARGIDSYEGSGAFYRPAVRPSSPLAPAPCMTPLSPDQLETWSKRLSALMKAAPERAPRSLLRGAGLQGLPLEQVIAAHEAEP